MPLKTAPEPRLENRDLLNLINELNAVLANLFEHVDLKLPEPAPAPASAAPAAPNEQAIIAAVLAALRAPPQL
jgi:hypothetical protein